MEHGYTLQDITWVELANKAWEARKKRKMYEAAEELAFKELMEASAGRKSFGGGFILSSTQRLGSIDYANVPELEQVDLQAYRKAPVVIWKLEKE